MKTQLFVCFLLFALVPFVFGEGQVILDEIRSVKSDLVTFLDPLFTNYGVIDDLVTDSFAATRQFELKVGVADTYLTSQQGLTSFEASLGALISSKNGDVSFQAESDIAMQASVFHFNALDLVSFEARHDMSFDSLYATSFIGGNIRAQATNSMIFGTDGEIDFNAGSDLNLNTHNSLSLFGDDVAMEAANGDIYLLAGAEFSLITEQLIIDGIHSVSVEAAGSLDFNAQSEVYFYVSTLDAFVDHNIVFDFDEILVTSPDSAVFASSNIELDSDTSITVSGTYPESVISLDFLSFLNITAASTVNFKTTGEGAPVTLVSRHNFDFFIADATTFTTPGSLTAGHNKTDTFTITAPTYTLVSDYTNHRSENELLVTASNQLLLDASHIIFNGNGVKTISTTGQINSDSRDLYVITTPNSQTGSIISSGGNTAFTSKSLTVSGFAVDGNIQQTQTYTVGALNINSNDGTNFDTTLKANSGDLALQVEDDIDISSSNFIITASDSIDFTLLDYTLTADLYGLRTNTFSIQSTNDLSFTSGFNIAIEGDDMTLTSDSASTYRSQGVIVVGGEDITFHAAKNLFVSASEYHIDVTALATWDLDELLTLNVFDDVYLKTSDFQLIADRRMSWTITGDWIGSYGELTFTSTDTITYDTLDNGDIHVRSGGDLSLNSDGQQTIAAGDAIDMFAQEEIRFSSGGPSTFTSLGPIDIYGSEEFYFNAESAFSVTATDTATYNADIITQHSDTILSLHSSGDIDVTTGNYHIEANQDAIITADSNLNMITLDNSAENLLEFNSPNFLFTAAGALTIRSSLNIDLTSQDSIIQSTNSLFKTDVSTDMAFDVGSLGITAGTTVTSKSTLLTSYVAGYDDFVHFNANDRFLVTGALTTELIFDSETSILYQAKTSIDTLLDLDITLTSGDTTTIDANGILNVNAHDDLFIQSAEDLSLATINDKNVLITVGGDAKYTAGRDVNIIANGLDPLVSLNCSISVTTNDGDATFTSEAGKLELNSWKTFEIRSYDTEVETDGNIAIDSSGSMFWESYESGIIYIVDEPDADGFLVTTERTYDGNQEYLSTLAGVKYLGYQGFAWTSADLRVWAQNGITIISNDTSAPLVTPAIHFDVGSAITSGARGLTVVAGLEAPIINEDYLLTTGNNLFIESQDLLSFFSLSTASLTAGTGDVVFTTYEGNTIDFSVGGNLISTAKNSIEFSTEDGDQYYNSNSKSFISNASGQVSIFTNDGPIELDSLGGQFNLLGADLEFESNMDTKITSLAFIQITAGDSLQLVGQDENKSGVLIKNQRDIDNIYINGNYISGAITQIQDLSNLEYTNLETQVLGDNIDIITGGSATFDSEGDSIFIGTDSLPLVKMTAAAPPGGDGPAGDAIYVEAEDTILLSSANTITSVSNSVNFGALEFNILSTGFIYLQTQTDDVTFEATLGDINVISELITTTVIGSHTISGTAVGSGSILLSSDGQDFGDRLEFDVSTSVTVGDGSALFSTGNLFDLDIGGDLQISTDTFKIANNLGFDPTYVLPYYNFISYERQSISLDFDTLESTITNELSFKVGIDTTNVPPLFNTPELYIETTVYNLDTVDFSVSNNNLDSNVQYGSVKATSFGVTGDSTFATLKDAAIYSIGNAQYIITGDAGLQFSTDSIYKIGGDTTFNLATSWNILANGATGSQAVEFSSSENLLTAQATTFTITNSVSPLGDPQYFDVEGGNILLTNGAGIFTIDGKANSKLISFYGEFSSSAAPLTITANDLLYNATATTSSLVFATQADMTITTPLGKFISSEFLSVHSDAATDITASASANVHTEGGDINILGDDTITFLPTASASFDAYGYQPDNNRAITIDAGGILTFNPTETLTIATETTQTHYSASVALTSPIMSFTTTNYESPITLLIDNGNSQITGTSTIIEGGRSAQFNAANGITVSAAGAPVRLSTNFRRNGILFDTDLKQNFHASTTFTSTGTTTADAQDIRFLIDRARGDLGVVQFKSTTSTNLRSTLGTDRPISFLSTAGNIEMAASTSLVATADYFEFTGENQQITGAAGTTLNIDSDYGQIKSLTGDIYGNTGTSAAGWSITTANGGSVTATTDGFGDNNDILLTSPSGILLDANAAINIFGNNGDAAVIIESYTPNTGSIAFTSTGNDMVVDSLSGIQFVFSGHGTENPNGILFTVADDLFVTTWEKRGSIYFQSDSDVVMSASQTIRHTEIAARLGFFSVTPAHIFTVGLQSTEGCVQSGFCGTAPGDSDDVSGSIGYFGNRVTTLQLILRQYGLIDWTQFMRP